MIDERTQIVLKIDFNKIRMKKNLAIYGLLLFNLIYLQSNGQGFASTIYNYSLLMSGYSKVKEFKDGKLKHVFRLDSSQKILTKLYLIPNKFNSLAPIYDKDMGINSLSKTYYNAKGNIDSSYHIVYPSAYFNSNSKADTSEIDTTITIYNYPLIEDWPMNCQIFRVKKGTRKLLRTHYFGYDGQGNLILNLQDEGRLQFYYEYNENKQIEKEIISRNTIINYQYDDLGRTVKRSFNSEHIFYEYNDQSLLKSRRTEGKNSSDWSYEYIK